ncbi:MAG: 4Fe-4S dicluster domain-containing protein [Actinobacteria bacterium]|nr:4Fe-4S dicluster domain-containing protein [Actinomycetota bacterium]
MKKKLTRREFIKISAGIMGLAVISSPLVAMLRRSRTSVSAQQTGDKTLSQWCMVIDLRKCEGCVTIDKPPQCTESCIATHFVPNGQQWIEVYTLKQQGGGIYFMPTPCYQCENAPCVNVCPVEATYHNEEGIVLIDHYRCIGCRLCMAACPYHRRFFNWGTPDLPPEAAFAKYSPDYPVPAKRGTVIKCMFCSHFLKAGQLPACVAGCPMKALYIGDLSKNMASNGVEVVELSRFIDANNAFRYKEELGTQPRVWYIPGYGQLSGRSLQDLRERKPTMWLGG